MKARLITVVPRGKSVAGGCCCIISTSLLGRVPHSANHDPTLDQQPLFRPRRRKIKARDLQDPEHSERDLS
ncbi:hypothetical protein BDM02DRAFT_3124945 [Thelephora ganbajun]|uniref:Uncharacterized protein n=1 Tax=Thelephora ganbajun TaxID=370292 RepID=A0ACB6YXH2_THEGA|nr:hypothetical protein BDM02DRAFT_3124945 [Thelephora ganbajun]